MRPNDKESTDSKENDLQSGYWESRPGDKVIRHPRERQISPIQITIESGKSTPFLLQYPLLVAYCFIVVIVICSTLMTLPMMNSTGNTTPYIDAFFTTISALTVTGLTINNSAVDWTAAGQSVILCMIFVGGLAYMLTVILWVIMIRNRSQISNKQSSLGIVNPSHWKNLARLAVKIGIFAIGIQVIGLVLLLIKFWFVFSPGEAIFQAIFQSISSFNNAGFVILNETQSLASYKADDFLLGVTALLILSGSISYWVIFDILRRKRFLTLTLNTKLVLIGSGALILLGAFAFLTFEYNNPVFFDQLTFWGKLKASLFESISGRTAGFTVVDYRETSNHTNFVFVFLMLIGGASASVAGGLKINTLMIVIVGSFFILKGGRRAGVFGRQISYRQVNGAIILVLMVLGTIFFTTFMLMLTDPRFLFKDLLFESASALGTAGLSTGITSELSVSGKIIIVFDMLFGRLGLLLMAMFLMKREETNNYRYAEERIILG